MLSIVTIVLDGMPFMEWQWEVIQKLSIPWKWIIVEGVGGNTADTSWCRAIPGRLSRDGTTEFLDGIKDQRVEILRADLWENKTLMMNAATELADDGVLMQLDSDEIHTVESLEKVHSLFASQADLGAIKFPCQYFVGPDLVLEGEDCYGNKHFEWLRAWRFRKGMTWEKHEPPTLSGIEGRTMEQDEARLHGLTFRHFAYATEQQVRFKAEYYPYDGLLNQWKSLQEHKHFPDKLQKFFPFVDDRVMVKRYGEKS